MITKEGINKITISPLDSIRDAMRIMNRGALQIVLVADSNGALKGVVTDGDIRRGLLDNLSLESPVSCVMNANPIVVRQSTELTDVINLMKQGSVEHVPILDFNNLLVGLHTWNEVSKAQRDNFFIIMAGGLGSRLMPYTKDCPKPMLLVQGKPILERIIMKAKTHGFNNFIISVNYLGHMIEGYFGNGSKFGVNISYIAEKNRLGTIGALSMSRDILKGTFIVANGDVITDINYSQMMDFHVSNDSMATIAVRLHEIQNPYGVVHMDGNALVGFEEKPVYRSYINTGVYVLNSEALGLLNEAEFCDAPTLLSRVLQKYPQKSCVYVTDENWLDVGRPEDLREANEILSNHVLDKNH